MAFQLSLIVIFISVCILTATSTTAEYKSVISRRDTSSPSHLKSNISKSSSRSKRFLIYPGGGASKLIVGFSQPVNLLDKYPYRQLSLSYSLHMQYTPPIVPVYWWTYFVNNTAWEHDRSNERQRHAKQLAMSHLKKVDKARHIYHHNPHLNHYDTFVQRRYRQPAIVYDASRYVVYKAVETIFASKGLPGERCLLRTICEISQRPLHENNAIYGIINAIFSPSVPNVDGKYLRAKQLGAHGVSCEKIYWICHEGLKWLEQMSYYS